MDAVQILILVALGLTAGTLGSLLGLGGGFLIVPALILLMDKEAKIATGTAIAVIVPTMIVALWRRGGYEHVDWKTAAVLAVGAIVGAMLGSWLSTKASDLVIRRIFAGVLLFLAAVLFFRE
ncbi:MAG: TSUP family transporter [Planctomycetota bacterium]|jgi:uncharacterized membrane protein YfcA